MSLILSVALAIFAAIEAYSTYLQLMSNENNVKFLKAKDELKEAYGPLYALLNKPIEEEDKTYIKLKVDEKFRLDEILSSYPYMFTQEINEYWQRNIRKLKTETGVEISFNGRPFLYSSPLNSAYMTEEYRIPVEFVNIFNLVYEKKVKNFNTYFPDIGINLPKPKSEIKESSLTMESTKPQNPNRIDSLFRVALVLLGILASAVIQLNQDNSMVSYVVRVTTLPFLILIVVWLVKELLKEYIGFNKIMALTEFSWDFWTVTFFYYTITFINSQSSTPLISNPISAGLLLIPYVVFIFLVRHSYSKIHSDKGYFKNPLWRLLSIVLFVFTYVILVFAVFPFEFL